MFDGSFTMSFHLPNLPPVLQGSMIKNRIACRGKPNESVSAQLSSILIQTDEKGSTAESKKISGSSASLAKYQTQNSLLSQANTVGIIGGVSVFSTLIFLEKLVWMSSRNDKESLPFVVCSDPAVNEELPSSCSSPPFCSRAAQTELNYSSVVENLRHKRAFLEQSGARCIVLPCHVSHAWHNEISEDCSLPFFHVGECVARELKEANLKPLEAGTNVRIGVLATDAILGAGFYQDKLESQGFEVLLPDKGTMEHIVIPAIESLKRRDLEGARNLLRIAIQILLVRAANTVILACDEMLGLLPHDDPLLRKCTNPMDALARSTIKWAKSAKQCTAEYMS